MVMFIRGGAKSLEQEGVFFKMGDDNYLRRHSSANISLNESSPLNALAGNVCTSLDGNHDDIFSIIEQAGITFGK
jgi:hypothetical protein